jgi:hypothetical protein
MVQEISFLSTERHIVKHNMCIDHLSKLLLMMKKIWKAMQLMVAFRRSGCGFHGTSWARTHQDQLDVHTHTHIYPCQKIFKHYLQPKSMQQQAVTSVISVFWSRIVWFWLQWVLYIQHCSYLQFVSRVASSVWILGIPLASGMKWSLILAHKLLIAWMRILDDNFVLAWLLLIAIQYHDWVFLLLLEMQQNLKMQILYNGLPRLWTNYYLLIYYTHSQELMKPVGSHGSLSLQFVMSKLMVWLFVYMTQSVGSHGSWLLFVMKKVMVW